MEFMFTAFLCHAAAGRTCAHAILNGLSYGQAGIKVTQLHLRQKAMRYPRAYCQISWCLRPSSKKISKGHSVLRMFTELMQAAGKIALKLVLALAKQAKNTFRHAAQSCYHGRLSFERLLHAAIPAAKITNTPPTVADPSRLFQPNAAPKFNTNARRGTSGRF